jgi:hypothetical protein
MCVSANVMRNVGYRQLREWRGHVLGCFAPWVVVQGALGGAPKRTKNSRWLSKTMHEFGNGRG